MIIKCNATGSKGNSYYIQADNSDILLIDAGVNERQMMASVPIDLIQGLVVSHNHHDHNCIAATKIQMSEKIKKYGIPVFTCDDMVENEMIKLGSFTVIPIECEHDVKCFGFLILVDDKVVLFATDTKIIPYVENVKIDYFIVECNYQLQLMQDKIDELIEKNGANYEIERYRRVYHNHCSLETLREYFYFLGYKPSGIYTIHKSNSGLLEDEDVIETLKPYCDDVRVMKEGNRIIC